jgi:hypothetical protein
MADTPIYVAVITASAAILGAAVSAFSIAFQNARNAERDRRQRHEEQQQRHAEEARTACMDLLRAAIDLRNQVENNQDYQGEEMRSRLAQVRRHASDAALHAVLIGTIEPEVFAASADGLAKAARRVALAAAENTNLEMKMSNEVPDLRELSECIDVFSSKTVAYAKGTPLLPSPVVGDLPRDLKMRR